LVKGKGKASFHGAIFNTPTSWVNDLWIYCVLTPNKYFPHSCPEAPRIMQIRETSTSEGGNYFLPPILPSDPQFPEKLMGILTFRKAGTWDILFYFPSE
jgi:hypothetical protein